MIRMRYRDGMIIGLRREEVDQILPYLRYSTYMFTKLYEDRPKFGEDMCQLFEGIHYVFSQIQGTPLSRTFYAATQRRLQTMHGRNYFSYRANNIPGDASGCSVYLFFSAEAVTRFAAMNYSPATTSQRLVGRLPEIEFPSAATWNTFVLGVGGVETAGDGATLQAFAAVEWDRCTAVFPVPVNIAAWAGAAMEVLEIFAKDRRTKLDTVKKILGVKL